MPFDKAQCEHICPCGIGAEPCPDASGRPLCAEHERLTGEGWRLGPDGCYRRPEPCEYCDQDVTDPPSKLCPGCQAYREHTT